MSQEVKINYWQVAWWLIVISLVSLEVYHLIMHNYRDFFAVLVIVGVPNIALGFYALIKNKNKKDKS